MSPRTSSIVQIIFSFWSFEISGGILRSQKIINLDSFSKHLLAWPHLDFTSLGNDCPFECCKITVILFDSMLQNIYCVLPNQKGH